MSMERVLVRPSGLAGDHLGKFGWATYAGKASNGEDIYRVIFYGRGHQQSGKFRASDLRFEERKG